MGAELKPAAPQRRWYVVYTRPKGENLAIEHLRRQSYQAFCPRIRKTIRHARKAAVEWVPLFPSYCFVQLDLSGDRWRSVNGTVGVSRLLMQGELPQPVPVGVVEALAAEISEQETGEAHPCLHVGDIVRISEGPLANLVGTLNQIGATGRVRVLLDILARAVPVSVDRELLEPAG